MKDGFPDKATAGRATSVHQQERGSADQPSPPVRPSESGDKTSFAVDGGFTPTASKGREKDPQGKQATSSQAASAAFEDRLRVSHLGEKHCSPLVCSSHFCSPKF